MRKLLLLAAGLIAVSGFAENLIYNSGFELGSSNWDYQSLFRKPDTKPYAEKGDSLRIVTEPVSSGQYAMAIKPLKLRVLTWINSHSFVLKPNTEYTISFDACSDHEKVSLGCRIMNFRRNLRRDASGKILPASMQNGTSGKMTEFAKNSVKLTKKYQRFSKTFRTDSATQAGTLQFQAPKGKATIFIDNVQVTEGKNTVYAPQSDLEAVVETSDYLYDDPKAVSGKVLAISSNADLKQTITLSMVDTYHGKTIHQLELPLDLKKGIRSEIPFSFEGPFPYGEYVITTSLQPRTTESGFQWNWGEEQETISFRRVRRSDKSIQSSAGLVIVPKPGKAVKGGFLSGTTAGLSNDGVSWYGIGKNSYKWTGRELMRLIRLSGGNFYRVWDPGSAAWSAIEPEKGKFDWALTDQQIQDTWENGINIMCVLGGALSEKSKNVPEWAWIRDAAGKPVWTMNTNPFMKTVPWAKNFRYMKVKMEDWCNFIDAYTKRYKGKIKAYEILNESGLYMDAETYMYYMKPAAEIIRKNDPDALIFGICATQDMGSRIEDFTAECMKLGADKYLDAITFHPYAKLDNSKSPNQMEGRRKMLRFFRKNNYKAKIFNGENYYIIPEWEPRVEVDKRVFPEDIARHILIDLGEGCMGATPTHLDTLTSSRRQALQMHGTPFTGFCYPDARYVAHAIVMKYVTGAKPLITHELPAKGLGYSFTKAGKFYTAIWNSVVPDEFYAEFPADAVICDVMGNPVKSRRIILNAKPFYIEWPAEYTSKAKIAEYFKQHPVKCRYPFRTGRVFIVNGEKLVLSLKNLSGRDLKNEAFDVSSVIFEEPVKLQIPFCREGGDFVAEVPVKLKQTAKLPARITIIGKDFELPVQIGPAEGITITSEAPYYKKLDKTVIGTVPESKDLSASITAWYESQQKRLFITLNVKDDKPGELHEKKPHESDSIELFLDRSLFELPWDKYGTKTSHLFFLRKNGIQNQNGIFCRINDRKDGYTATLEIPVPTGWIGLDIGVNDSDGEKRKTQLIWNGTADNHMNRDHFKLVKIQK